MTAAPADAVKRTMAEVVAQRRTEMSPGRRFAEACGRDGLAAAVDYDVTITDSLTSSRRKPRFPVRNMMRVVDLSREPRASYWHESPPRPEDAVVAGADTRRELASRFHASPVPELLPTTAWVQVPDRLWEDPETFESFFNYRLIVRLSTAENVTILCGEHGLLAHPGIGRITAAGPHASPLLSACNEVEQMGGTADGLVLNPVDYYRFLGDGRLVDVLEGNGVFVVRTRLVEPGTALVGDFGHGAQLFDAGRSTVRFAEPPPGTFTEQGDGPAVLAQIHERAVITLPTNFFLVSL